MQQHQHPQRAVGEREAPVAGGDDQRSCGRRTSRASLDDDVGEIDHAAGIADLVVVPGIDLEQGAVGDHRARPVDDRAARVVGVVGRDQRPRLEAEDAGERPGRGGAEQVVDLAVAWSAAPARRRNRSARR